MRLVTFVVAVLCGVYVTSQDMVGFKVEVPRAFRQAWAHYPRFHNAHHGPYSLPGSYWESTVEAWELVAPMQSIVANERIQHLVPIQPEDPPHGPLFKIAMHGPPFQPYYADEWQTQTRVGDHGAGFDVAVAAMAMSFRQDHFQYSHVTLARHYTNSLIDQLSPFDAPFSDPSKFGMSAMVVDKDGTIHLIVVLYNITPDRILGIGIRIGPDGSVPGARIRELPPDGMRPIEGYGLEYTTDTMAIGDSYREDLDAGHLELVFTDLEGSDWAAPIRPQAWTVVPNGFVVPEGELFDGDLQSIQASDGVSLSFFNDSLTLGGTVDVTGRSPYSNPASLQVFAMVGADRSGLAAYLSAMRTDGTFRGVSGTVVGGVSVEMGGTLADPWRFVDPASGLLAARIAISPINDENPTQDGWLLHVDAVRWVVA